MCIFFRLVSSAEHREENVCIAYFSRPLSVVSVCRVSYRWVHFLARKINTRIDRGAAVGRSEGAHSTGCSALRPPPLTPRAPLDLRPSIVPRPLHPPNTRLLFWTTLALCKHLLNKCNDVCQMQSLSAFNGWFKVAFWIRPYNVVLAVSVPERCDTNHPPSPPLAIRNLPLYYTCIYKILIKARTKSFWKGNLVLFFTNIQNYFKKVSKTYNDNDIIDIIIFSKTSVDIYKCMKNFLFNSLTFLYTYIFEFYVNLNLLNLHNKISMYTFVMKVFS